jgi:hypothetical protein
VTIESMNLGDKPQRPRQLRVLRTNERRKERDKNGNHDVTYQTIRDSSNTRIVPILPSRGTPYQDSHSCQELTNLILNAWFERRKW